MGFRKKFTNNFVYPTWPVLLIINNTYDDDDNNNSLAGSTDWLVLIYWLH